MWLVNTGWTGGPYGVGTRVNLGYTRAMIRAAITGQLKNIPYDRHPVFGVEIPTACPGVPSGILYTRDTWSDKDAYDEQALMLAKKFIKNFEKYEAGTDAEIRAAAPLA